VARLEDPHGDLSHWQGFTPDGAKLVVVSRLSGAIHVWDLRMIRRSLKTMGLDWDWPEFPPADQVRELSTPLAEPTLKIRIVESPTQNATRAEDHAHAAPEKASAKDVAVDRQRQWDRELAGLSREVERAADRVAALRARAKWLLVHGRFEEADRDYARLVQLDPHEHWHWFFRGCLLAYLGPERAYREHCRQMLAQFAESEDAPTLHRTTRAALLLPPSGTDASEGEPTGPEELAQRAERALQLEPGTTWAALVKGMAEHRAGRYESAAQWMERYQQLGRCRRAAGSVVADSFLALGRWQVGNQVEARAALERAARRAAADLPALDSGVLVVPGPDGGSAEDWLMAQVALREAQRIILPGADSF
jgi:tetratricopeptide (TPR) repeat protein